MSSILQALKKAEQQDSQQQDHPAAATAYRRRFINVARRQPSRFSKTGVLLLLGLTTLLISGGLIGLHLMNTPTILKPNDKETAALLPPPLPHQKNAPVSDNKKLLPQAPGPAVSQKTADGLLKASGNETAILTARPSDTAQKPSTIETQKELLQAPPVIQASQPADAKTIDPTASQIQDIENETLKIQAISWSSTPGDRVVVINNEIVMEGDRISGYKVTLIQKDEVILERSGNRFSLKFKYR